MNHYFELHNGEGTKVAAIYPNQCPICKKMIYPDFVMDSSSKSNNHISLFFHCPSCENGFISHYKLIDRQELHRGNYYTETNLIGSYPKTSEKMMFDKTIEDLSPNFCEIYNQAYSSEIYELNQLSGIGYRKALEFLIKDYCIHRNPDKSEKIKSALLGQVINDYIDSDKIKNLSKASVWIGNDETHYVRKFESKDISDLKKFIAATIAFITYELVSDEADKLLNL